ncbi:hypothetical protein [Mucilaginibacter ginsenosidivorans]|uniref:Uncharacterized protein n=1 Tax=Mucilaginibacter ginsenosidivorans TaxID=398053 RepID=A0A5B8V227_9SPHI|nr:hypothetical protein [Mucilaginibacter ginsenosidivorans]QEC64873.1 hypothetical protein FRZ54_20655 [Mucilaginibacter ginsenosidivorans]
MSEYLDAADETQDNHNRNDRGNKKATIETRGPAKDHKTKVLHKDGSFAELPPKESTGSGALDGTVGRGT